MVTCSLLVFFVSFGVTRNLTVSSAFAGGYYAVMAGACYFLQKTRFPQWLRFTGQVFCAAALLVYLCGRRNRTSADVDGIEVVPADKGELLEKKVSSLPEMRSDESPRQLSKDEKVRDFTLREAPQVWRVYQELVQVVEQQEMRLDDAGLYGRNMYDDADFRTMSEKRDDMVKSRDLLKGKLEHAYILSRNLAASPNSKELDESLRKALEDCVEVADAVKKKFEKLRSER